MDFDGLSTSVIGCAIEVHKHLGPGLLESAYQHCLAYELEQQGLRTACQVAVPGLKIGLLMNFNTPRLKDGIRRFVH